MSTRNRIDRNRRHLLQAMLAFPAAGIAGFTGVAGVVRGMSARDLAAFEPSAALPLTPACDDGDDDPTPAQTAGPYFKPHSPERSTLVEPGMGGTPLVITGRVVTSGCVPIAGALLDFWQADHDGQYDTTGFRLRGHQYTDRDGRFSLSTIVPGLYPGRTRHVHVKAQAPNHPALTTQLYFPGEPRNTRDSLFTKALLIDLPNLNDGREARDAAFTFVLRAQQEPDSGRYAV
jgi:protocatechuate 3,4-dioxygenase beta subunit